MIACIECGMENYLGAIFCQECAAPLHPTIQGVGRPVSNLPLAPATGSLEHPAPLAKELAQPHQGKKRLRFVFPKIRGDEVVVTLSGVVWIGRADSSGSPLALDLTPYQGYERGVSRRHATIELCTPGAVLIDRNSSNGTWLNGSRLRPGEPYLLPDQAQVRFGNLVVYLKIED